jgi:hypothetical protein
MEGKFIAVNTVTRHGLTDQGWQPCYENIHGKWVISTMEPKWMFFKTQLEAQRHLQTEGHLGDGVEIIEYE